MTKKELGNFGEDLAVKYLIRNGYKIVGRKFRTKLGEIDVIAKDKSKNEIVFIEVKTRTSDKYGQPEEAVGFFKQQKLVKAIYYYINTYNLDEDFRVDVIGIKIDFARRIARLKHFKNALN